MFFVQNIKNSLSHFQRSGASGSKLFPIDVSLVSWLREFKVTTRARRSTIGHCLEVIPTNNVAIYHHNFKYPKIEWFTRSTNGVRTY